MANTAKVEAIGDLAAASGWKDLFTGTNFSRSIALSGGVAIHAVFIFIVATILPKVVADVGGVAYYAWSTTLFMVGSIAAAAAAAQTAERIGPRTAYRVALGFFVAGSALCALAPSMTPFIVGRFLQGLGGGLLTALAFSTIRQVFAENLQARAIAMVSGVWGVCALLGPLLGGVVASLGSWRFAFWIAVPLCLLFLIVTEKVIPRTIDASTKKPLPLLRLAMLSGAALAVSAGSVPGTIAASSLGILVGVLLLVPLVVLDRRAEHKLLPSGAFDPRNSLGAASATMGLIVLGASSAISFLPYILSIVHGISELNGGYIVSLESCGWTTAAILTASATPRRIRKLMIASPSVIFVAMIAATLSIAFGILSLTVIAVAAIGVGIGMAWAHFGTHMIKTAQDGELDIAAACIATIQLIAMAFGSALAGTVVNLAGLGDGSDPARVASAGTWLFGIFTLGPLLAIYTAFRLVRPTLSAKDR